MTLTGRRAVLVMLLAAVAGCSRWRDPRDVLVRLNVPYTTDALIGQAGAGDAESVAAFLAAGMDANARDAAGHTALMNASAAGQVAVMRTLLEHGAQVNVTSSRGMTPLAAAILNDHPDASALLLDAGAALDAPTADRAPLMLAIRARRPRQVTQLLDKGAPAYIQDHQWSALMIAAFLGDMAIVNALLAKDPNLNAANDEGATALMYAASAGHLDVVQALLATGAAIDARDGAGFTAHMLAANNGRSEIAALLQDNAPRAVGTATK